MLDSFSEHFPRLPANRNKEDTQNRTEWSAPVPLAVWLSPTNLEQPYLADKNSTNHKAEKVASLFLLCQSALTFYNMQSIRLLFISSHIPYAATAMEQQGLGCTVQVCHQSHRASEMVPYFLPALWLPMTKSMPRNRLGSISQIISCLMSFIMHWLHHVHGLGRLICCLSLG